MKESCPDVAVAIGLHTSDSTYGCQSPVLFSEALLQRVWLGLHSIHLWKLLGVN